HAARRIVPQHALNALRGRRGAVADDYLARVLRIAHADTAAMVERDPGGAARAVQERIEQRPVGNRIRAVAHRLGLAVRARHRAGIEMVAPDDERRLELAACHHLVECQSGPMSLAEPEPADARRQSLETNALTRQ